MKFRYVGFTPEGRRAVGVVEADTEETAESLLWRTNLTVAELKRELPLPTLEEALPTIFGFKRQDLVSFCADLASLLAAGIALLPALRMLRQQARKASVRRVLAEVITSLETGSSFSQACSRHPQAFPTLFLRLVEIGEEVGNLELVLRQVAQNYEKELALLSRIRRSLAYPIMVVMLAMGAIFIMVNFVLPAMRGLFAEFKAELPLTTRILVAVASLLEKHGPYFLGGLVVVAFLLVWYLRTPGGRRWWDHALLRMPFIREASRQTNLSRLARTLLILQRAGVSLSESLTLMVQTTTNMAVRQALTEVNAEVRGGRLLSQALGSQRFFPPLLVQMVAVGEQTGRLDANLEALANYYERETDKVIAQLTGLIEPALILGAGGLVGFIAVSVITPIYGIIHQIR